MSIMTTEKLKPVIEIGIVALFFFAIRELLSSVSYHSQIAEVVCLILITILLKRRGSGWRALGFRLPDNWLRAVGYTILCIVTIGLVFNFIIQPLFPEGANEINAGKEVSFNHMLFQLIVIGMGAAAIGEELLFRGFVLNNLNDFLGRNALGTAGAVVLQAVMFALLHSGTQGMVSAGVIGLILGVFYLLANRNLLVVMVAHAVPDALSIISNYQAQGGVT